MKLTKLLSLLLVAVMLFSFAACTGDGTTDSSSKVEFDGPEVAIADNNGSEYVIIRNKNGSDYETDIAVDLQDRIRKITGAELKISNDSKAEKPKEIILGTARSANAELGETQWKVSHDGSKFIITAGSDKALELAYTFFLEQFLGCKWLDTELEPRKSIKVPKEFVYQDEYMSKEAFLAQTQLIKYPEYPETAIPRDYDYFVKVTQGDKTIEIPVYNRTIGSNYFISGIKDGDIHRRYAEFAFSGEPATIEVTANLDFTSVSVMPSSKGIDFTVEGNKITYTIDKPQTTMIKLNDNKDTLLAIFAEEPEYEDDIPDKSLSTVHYYEAGVHEPENGEIVLGTGETLYLAPGAVVKARVFVSGMNVKICGRGTLLESSPNRTKLGEKASFMIQMESAKDVEVSGIKVVDAHTFNITIQSCENVTIHDVKMLANQISTDGISWWGKNTNVYVTDCFWHVSDDVFVVGGECINCLVENCVVGADYGVFTPTTSGEGITFRNIDVFRSGRLIKIINDGGSAVTTMENIYAEDVDSTGAIVDYAPGKSNPRKYVLKNVSINGLKAEIISGANIKGLDVTFDNVWIDGKLVTADTKLGASAAAHTITITPANDKEAAKVGADNVKKVTAYKTEKVFINALEVETAIPTVKENGTVYVPVKEVLEALDFTNIKLNDSKLTFEYKDEKYEVAGGSTEAVSKGNKVQLSTAPVVKDGNVCVPLDFFKTVLGTDATYDEAKLRVNITNIARGGNLLRNGDMEQGMTTDWITRWFTPMYLSTEAHSGKYAMRTLVDADSYQPGGANGIYQDIADVVRRYGRGTYKVSVWVKKSSSATDSTRISLGISDQYDIGSAKVTIAPTTDWKKMEYIYQYNGNPETLSVLYFCVGYSDGGTKGFLMDDMIMEKIK